MKSLKLFLCAILILATVSHSRPAKAAAGALISTPVLVAGLVIGGVGVLGTGYYLHKCSKETGDTAAWCSVFVVLLGAPVVLVGLVVLDGEQQVAFQELDESEAAKIGVSRAELAVFNSEIDQANMLLADVKSELDSIKKPTNEDSKRAWNSVKDLVSPETFATMQKIVSQN